MDVYQVDIAVCPNCKGDMIEAWQLEEPLYNRLFKGLDDLDEYCVVCPTCEVCFPEECAAHRTEYHRQIEHTDDGNGLLIELQCSDSPDMAGAASGWYQWIDNAPMADESFAGIDAQFASIMASS